MATLRKAESYMTYSTGVHLFTNQEFELHVTPEGDSFTVGAVGLARALSVRDGYTLVRNLPADEKGHTLERAADGDRKVWFVTEPGFYRILGQRQPARVKDLEVRTQVLRFQNWIYRDVLPALRRGNQRDRAVDEPVTYTWDEVTTIIRQRYGVTVSVAALTRMLRTAGILRQTGAPKKQHQHFFWFTGTAWEIHPHAVPFLMRSFEDTTRELEQFRFMQVRLELDGVGQQPARIT